MTDSPQTPHRGYNFSKVPAVGIPGLVFALGVVWMFWFGAPSYRPVVIAGAGIGVLPGSLLIL